MFSAALRSFHQAASSLQHRAPSSTKITTPSLCQQMKNLNSQNHTLSTCQTVDVVIHILGASCSRTGCSILIGLSLTWTYYNVRGFNDDKGVQCTYNITVYSAQQNPYTYSRSHIRSVHEQNAHMLKSHGYVQPIQAVLSQSIYSYPQCNPPITFTVSGSRHISTHTQSLA